MSSAIYAMQLMIRLTSEKISEIHTTEYLWGEPQVAGVFPTQKASNEENISMLWRHHDWSSTSLREREGLIEYL